MGRRGAGLAMQVLMAAVVVVFQGISSVEIREFDVPPLVEYGVTKSIVLDCNYDLGEEEMRGLDVKWFFNRSDEPFLQWIPGNRPQLNPRPNGDRFRQHLDIDFTIDDDNPDSPLMEAKRHRAIKIDRPSPELSGNYKCRVSGLYDEDFKQKDMVVYAPPLVFNFTAKNMRDTCELLCAVEAVGPAPKIAISWTVGNQEFVVSEPINVTRNGADPNLFDASVIISLNHSRLGDSEETKFTCDIILGEEHVDEENRSMLTDQKQLVYRVVPSLEDDEDFLLTGQSAAITACWSLTMAFFLTVNLMR